MLNILITSVSLSLALMGLWVCFNWEGMIFTPLAMRLERWAYKLSIPHWVFKPLWICPTCMVSYWGLWFYVGYGRRYFCVAEMVFIMLVTAFINTLWCILLNKTTERGC